MTTSRNTRFSSTGARIVADAFADIMVEQEGQPLEASDAAFGERKLNEIIKSWQRDGIHLWKDKEGAVFTQLNRRVYGLGNQAQFVCASGDDATIDNPVYATDDDWVPTQTTASVSAGTSVIPVASLISYQGVPYNMTCANTKIGVQNENGDLEWFVVDSVSTLDVTITGTLANDVNEAASVFIYRKDMDKPLKVYQENVRVYQQKGNYENPVHYMSVTDYNLLPQKNISGLVVQAAYQPKIDSGDLYVWPTTNTTSNVILFRFQSEFDIFDGTRTQDFPNEWIRPLRAALAAELSVPYGIDQSRQQMLYQRASALYEDVLAWDQDNSSLFIQPQVWIGR